MLQEEKRSSSAHFITLTYESAFLPISSNGHMTLDKSAFPSFIKRLRRYTSNKLKYYACGEYGSQFSRPHYHAIVFNVDDPLLFAKAWTVDGCSIGVVDVGQVSGDSIAYVSGYINKRSRGAARRNDDRIPEFSLMSKGLGSNYLTPAVKAYHLSDLSRNYLTKDGGDKIALPRFYRDKIYDDDDKAWQRGLAQSASSVSNSEQYSNFLKLYGHIEGYSYDLYCESLTWGAVEAFYNNLKPRLL